MRSDTKDSSQQQPAQQRHNDEAWDDWNAAQVSTLIKLYTVAFVPFHFLSFRSWDTIFFIFYVYRFRGK